MNEDSYWKLRHRVVLKFSESLGFSVFKAAIRNLKREVIKQLIESKDVKNITIPAKKKKKNKKHGRPLLFPKDSY